MGGADSGGLVCQYSQQLIGLYQANNQEEQLRDAYEICLDQQMHNAAGRKHYAAAIVYLKKLKGYPEGAQLVKRLAERWRQTYPRRSSMIDELGKAGY